MARLLRDSVRERTTDGSCNETRSLEKRSAHSLATRYCLWFLIAIIPAILPVWTESYGTDRSFHGFLTTVWPSILDKIPSSQARDGALDLIWPS